MNPDPPPFSSTPLQAMSRGGGRGRVWERIECSGYEEGRWAAVFFGWRQGWRKWRRKGKGRKEKRDGKPRIGAGGGNNAGWRRCPREIQEKEEVEELEAAVTPGVKEPSHRRAGRRETGVTFWRLSRLSGKLISLRCIVEGERERVRGCPKMYISVHSFDPLLLFCPSGWSTRKETTSSQLAYVPW